MRGFNVFACGLGAAILDALAPMARAGTVTTLYNFNTVHNDACEPLLAFASGGVVYGTAALGGKGQLGVLFSLNAATGALTHLHDFTGGSDGQNPDGVLAYDGLLYGVTEQTPMPGYGNVYSYNPATGAFSVVYVFFPYQSGVLPGGSLIAAGGQLYGGTAYGGAKDHGGVFSVNPASGAEDFWPLPVNKGRNTFGPLLRVGGHLYGAAGFGGGSVNAGTIYKFDRQTGHISVVYRFKGGGDGDLPDSNLVRIGKMLYGVTAFGGGGGFGTVFGIDLGTGAETIIYRFNKAQDGQYPGTSLAEAKGMIYGTTSRGGHYGAGTILQVDPATGTYSDVYDFTGGTSDYGGPESIIYQDGTFYGTTFGVLDNDACGTAFSYVP
jgi:uncharacterized repeat protein (TIGR03803 family)